MPIKLDNKLPALDVLRSENVFIMDENRASSQDIRPMEVLILNLMPTKEVTEKTASGREKTRYIKCMRQREEIIWLCEHCGFSRVHEVRTNLLD